MEQRIEELALKCGAWTQVYGNRTFMIDEHFDIAKFAELIVQECATVVEKNLFQGIGWNTSRAVKRHFGIEDEE